jgi:short-subunit dehydrogenase
MSNATKKPVVVICGASAGIGRATAIEFARAGYQLGIVAREEKALEETREELQDAGARVLAIALDVADDEQVNAAADRFEKELGPIDVWVNSAMATVFGPATKMKPAELRRVTDVTYHGFVHGTLAALRHMQPRNRGTIVQVGSALAYRGIPLQSAYCAAKFAVRGFTDSLRCELLHENSAVRLTMVQLPAHNTPQFDWSRNHMEERPQPVPPVYQPEVAARAILKAARQAPRELWVGKASFQSIIGTMVMPGVLDRMLSRQAWDGQLTGDPALERADNLDEPVPDVHRTHGRFEDEAKNKAVSLSSTTTRLLLGGTALGLAAAATFAGAAVRGALMRR